MSCDSFPDKEKKALSLIENQLNKYDNPVIACSWGKDSLTVLHLVSRITENFQVLWNNTRCHYPSVYKLKRRLEKDWNLDVVETKAIKTFWQIVKEYGFPGVKGSDRGVSANAKCCYYIKKKPTKHAVKSHAWDLYFDGLTAYESDRRWLLVLYFNNNKVSCSHETT